MSLEWPKNVLTDFEAYDRGFLLYWRCLLSRLPENALHIRSQYIVFFFSHSGSTFGGAAGCSWFFPAGLLSLNTDNSHSKLLKSHYPFTFQILTTQSPIQYSFTIFQDKTFIDYTKNFQIGNASFLNTLVERGERRYCGAPGTGICWCH